MSNDERQAPIRLALPEPGSSVMALPSAMSLRRFACAILFAVPACGPAWVAIGATSGTEIRKMKKRTVAPGAHVYTRITDRRLEDLSESVKPWRAPNTEDQTTRPLWHNGFPYSGMSVPLLWSEGIA